MSRYEEKIIEGSYHYYKGEQRYSEENFSVFKIEDAGAVSHRWEAEILTRIDSGEFLKIQVEYVVNATFGPSLVTIEKSLGKRMTKEIYRFDFNKGVMRYSFRNDVEKKSFEKNVGSKFQVMTPAFCTSTLFTQSKRLDSLGRNQYLVLFNNNTWHYEKGFDERTIYVELATQESREVTINKQVVAASKILIYEFDAIQNTQETPITMFLSKHLGIPYKAEFPDKNTITVQNLKKLKSVKDSMY